MEELELLINFLLPQLKRNYIYIYKTYIKVSWVISLPCLPFRCATSDLACPVWSSFVPKWKTQFYYLPCSLGVSLFSSYISSTFLGLGEKVPLEPQWEATILFDRRRGNHSCQEASLSTKQQKIWMAATEYFTDSQNPSKSELEGRRGQSSTLSAVTAPTLNPFHPPASV